MPDVVVTGIDGATERLARIAEGCQSAANHSARVGTWLKYAWGIETGYHSDGSRARRLGGSFALAGAFAAVQGKISPALAAALPLGDRGVLRALSGLAISVLSGTLDRLTSTVYSSPIPLTKSGKPRWKRLGNLRDSYHMEID